jgi:hypothetical protein
MGRGKNSLKVMQTVKFTFFEALKVVVGNVTPEGFEKCLRGWSFGDELGIGDA